MPRTNYAKFCRSLKHPRQPIKELIVGRLDTTDISAEELAAALGVSDQTVYNRLAQPIEKWPYGQIVEACRFLDITSEELRERVSV